MSSFIVQDEVINGIVTYLHFNHDLDWLEREFSEAIAGSTGNFCIDLGAALFALNICAVEARYGTGEAAKFRPLDHKFAMDFATPRQVYDDIKNLQYQCCESDIPETQLYKLLITARAALADIIIEDLPKAA